MIKCDDFSNRTSKKKDNFSNRHSQNAKKQGKTLSQGIRNWEDFSPAPSFEKKRS